MKPIQMDHDYKQLDTPEGKVIEPCPVCGGPARLWQYAKTPTTPRELVVLCDENDPIGPQDGIRNEGCLLALPPDCFYRETIRDAIRFWNEFALALVELRARRASQ